MTATTTTAATATTAAAIAGRISLVSVIADASDFQLATSIQPNISQRVILSQGTSLGAEHDGGAAAAGQSG
jgi:hypothetical protein